MDDSALTLRRLALVSLLLAGLVALVGLGSRPLGAAAAAPSPGIGLLVLEVGWSLAILICLLGLGLFVLARRRKKMPEEWELFETPQRLPWVIRLLLILAQVALFGLLIVALARRGAFGPDAGVPGLLGAGGLPAADAGQLPSAPPFEWVFAAVTSIVLLVALVWWWRQRSQPVQPQAAAALFERALDDGLSALAQEADPRRAVILAYVAMQRALARQGLARRAAEAPIEYMLRVLADVPHCQHAVQRLTDLFEEARFSHHPIAEASRGAALEALAALRAALAGTA